MTLPPTQLCSQLDALRDEAGPLADRLDAAAEQLERGDVPAVKLLDELWCFSERLEELGDQAGISRDQWRHQTWWDLERSCVERAKRAEILSLLDALRQLRHAAQPDFAPLQELFAEVDAVRQALESRADVDAALLEALWNGEHAWCDLLQLASAGAEIADDSWVVLQERVARDLGRPLAVAAARGQIVLSREEGSTGLPGDAATALPAPASAGAMDRPREPLTAESFQNSPPLTPPAAATIVEARTGMAASASPAAGGQSSPESDGGADEPAVVPASADVADARAHSVFDDIDVGTSTRRPLSLQMRSLSSDRRDRETDLDNSAATASAGANLELRASVLIDEASERSEADAPVDVSPAEEPSEATAAEYGPEFFATVPQEPALQSAARAILDTPPPLPEAALAELVWWLVFEGQGGLAWHLSRALERLPAEVSFPPAWLVEAWVCGAAVQFPQGRVAAAVGTALAHSDSAAWEHRPHEWRRAARLLLHAAALRPALLCPETKAGAILRGFPLEPGTTQLYNYSQRVAAAGEQSSGRVVGRASVAGRPAARTRKLALLQEEIRRWQWEANGCCLRFERAEPLFQHAYWSVRSGAFQRRTDLVLTFSKWMHVLRLTEELLGPVLADDAASVAEVQALAARITANVVVGQPGDFPAGSKAIIVPEPAMQRHLLDAVAFAQRWLALLETASGAPAASLSPAVEVLCQEIRERQDDVLAELHQLAASADSVELQAAASCLMLAVEQVREILDPQTSPPVEEPPLSLLLSAELLRMPEVRLDADWFPACPPAEFIDHLLNYLAAPRPTWAMAYRLQAERGDDRATERLLSLPVWSTEQRQRLLGRRAERVAAVRRELHGELDALAKTLAAACRQGTLTPQDRVGFDARIVALRRKIDRSAVWGVQRSEVSELWRRLRKRGVMIPSSPERPAGGSLRSATSLTTPSEIVGPSETSVLLDRPQRPT
jgi:hypothetical protein